MTLTLHMHPLASFCHKVLIALYENDTEFEKSLIDFSDAQSTQKLTDHWPVGKIPVLEDQRRHQVLAETSIIIEYLQQHYPGDTRLLPSAPDAQLETRLWDRFFDLYISVPMQKIVTEKIRPEGNQDAFGVNEARQTLNTAYEMLERQLTGKIWICGEEFTLADCSGAPALFYSSIVHPIGPGKPALDRYFERLMHRPSVKRVIAEARPCFAMFPFHEDIPKRFLND